MPLKKMTNKEIKQQQKPWITKEILRTMNERDKIHKKWVGEKDIVTKTSLHTDYKNIRNSIRKDILTNKKKYFENFFSKNALNIKNTWKGIKSIIHISNNKKSQNISLLVNKNL